MVIAPNSFIKLVKVPLNIDNKNQLTFLNTAEQFQYFNSLPSKHLENAMYQRKDNVIRFPRIN